MVKLMASLVGHQQVKPRKRAGNGSQLTTRFNV